MFRSQLLWRLYSGYVAIILICTLIVGILVGRQVAENSLLEIHHSLAVRSELLAQIAKQALQDPHSSSLQQTIVELGKNTQSRLTVIASNGTVVADSQESPANMDNHSQRPEIIDAIAKGSTTTSRFSQTLQQQMVYRALRVTDKQKTIGFVRVSLPLSIIDNKLSQLHLIVVFGAAIAAIAALLLGFFFAKRFSDPLTKMTEVADAISKGDYNRRITIKHRDEVGKLAEAFNRMARSSALRMAEITADRNRLAMVFSGMVEGVIGIDQQQKIIHINQAAADLLELSTTTSINKPIWQEVRVPEIIKALEQSTDNQDIVKTQMRRSSTADDLLVEIYVAALHDDANNSIGAVIVLHDISELDRLERVRRDFVANASHELKTPITAIRGLTETILDDADMEPQTRQRFIKKVHSQSLKLTSLVSDLMTISRLESDQTEGHFEPFDVVEAARHSTSSANINCQEKQLSLKLEMPQDKLVINGDKQIIIQLIDNLLDNAIKYTPVGGLIYVSLSKDQGHKDQGHARLTVKDTGIGIEPQYQQRIFERFYRVDKARSRELGGTGLGLSIVKNITEQHSGSVALDSQPGSGSTFTVMLPLFFSEHHARPV